ncbi:DUF881 domain-containing protein [Cellulosimicrobium protaetiae]|uniref:DUF881 domain-containing protein n=1 Tax=Cellulosimicrobium protaetiae TaxID=2587808 RepID=A0A6M5UHU8_9MICO|nr:DUF881 domain-containing protein [Cellulosimicrobium protaetiae]QJW36821.1 DUF881 domain-containing protein [Cellulosimicrobium protaetiae]
MSRDPSAPRPAGTPAGDADAPEAVEPESVDAPDGAEQGATDAETAVQPADDDTQVPGIAEPEPTAPAADEPGPGGADGEAMPPTGRTDDVAAPDPAATDLGDDLRPAHDEDPLPVSDSDDDGTGDDGTGEAGPTARPEPADDGTDDPDDDAHVERDDAPEDGDSASPATESPATTEPAATTGTIGTVGRHGTPTQSEPRGLRGLGRALRPRASRSQIVVGILCALLGFALVVQVSQTQEDQLSSLRQSDLVRLLDDVTQRSGELEDQISSLEATRDELQSGSGRERAALELAEQQAQTLGILSGRLPAEGPGVEIEVVEGAEPLDAFALFNVLEELRNAGAEAMEVNGVRLVASSYFEDSADGIVVDGQQISSPYRWTVIGDPSTLETALEIPGGAMASLRSAGARTTITQQDRVEVTATVEPRAPEYATPVPADG